LLLRHRRLRLLGMSRLIRRGAVAMRSVAELEVQPAALIAVWRCLRRRMMRRLRFGRPSGSRRMASCERVRRVLLARRPVRPLKSVTLPDISRLPDISTVAGWRRSLRCRACVNRRHFGRALQ
jgi:hypothetical protein